MGRFVLGIILVMVLAPVLLLAWFRWGHPPVAVADPPLPFRALDHPCCSERAH